MKTRIIYFNLIFIILFIPFLQSVLHFSDVKPLKGAVVLSEDTVFSFKDWFSGHFQEKKEKYINDNFGYRNIFVRLNNQLAFWLFNKAKANGIVIGKDNYLYEMSYIDGLMGKTYIGDSLWEIRMMKIKKIQDELKKMDKDFILIFAPGKASFFPEYIPDKLRHKVNKSNYEYAHILAKKYSINTIDFYDYFLKNKNNSKYPLYPKYGIHWSYYGYTLASDSIIKFIEKLRNIRIPHLLWKEIEWDYPRVNDADIADGMNLLFDIAKEKLAYPKIYFESDSGKVKPNVLAVSDSYYWGPYSLSISPAFGVCDFWFYYKQAFPESFKGVDVDPHTYNLMESLKKYDVVLLIATEATLDKLGWDFIDNAYDLLCSSKPNDMSYEMWDMVIKIKEKMRSDEKWMEHLIQKSKEKGISLDSTMTIDAIWMIENQ